MFEAAVQLRRDLLMFEAAVQLRRHLLIFEATVLLRQHLLITEATIQLRQDLLVTEASFICHIYKRYKTRNGIFMKTWLESVRCRRWKK